MAVDSGSGGVMRKWLVLVGTMFLEIELMRFLRTRLRVVMVDGVVYLYRFA